jgi:branched-chain amino acid transport system ATP-binding protein
VARLIPAAISRRSDAEASAVPPGAALEVRNLEVVYSEVILALRGISLEVGAGETVALLGGNGAGKTTLLRAITGLLDVHHGEITKGSVLLDGERVDGRDPPEIVRAGVAQVMEGRRVFAELTVEENLRTGAFSARGDYEDARNRVVELFPVLEERKGATAGYLSGGEQQMLAIARALMASPRLLLLDEPSLGLAPIVTREVFAQLGRLNREQGLSVLVVEQNANLALDVGHWGYVLETGRIAVQGPAAQLHDDESVRKAYLGF